MAQSTCAVLSYNVENLLLEDGTSPYKRNEKRQSIAKTLIGASAGLPIGIIGLCEVETRLAIEQLLHTTPLQHLPLAILHKESPDRRGIDVALLYNTEIFQVVDTAWIPVQLSEKRFSRDILYAALTTTKQDTIHCFQVHFPSNFGGKQTSAKHRQIALRALQTKLTNLLIKRKNIICMGDFNATAADPLFEQISSPQITIAKEQNLLVNCCHQEFSKISQPSYQYKGKWEGIDLFFCSPSLLQNDVPSLNQTHCTPGAWIQKELLLYRWSTKSYAPRRSRSFNPKEHGWSDHLPIRACLNI